MESLELLAGRYRLGGRLGEGGASVVFRARDERLGVDCAVKVLTPPRSSLRAALRRRLQAEARVMARLAHPNILPVIDVGTGDGIDFVVMALAEGGSLADRLKSGGPVPPDEVVEIGLQVLSALEAAHREGVVHRDVKPQNLLVTKSGRVQLADFGIALVTGPGADRRTSTGVAMGSMAFMAPEQRLDASRVDATADLYATGTTLYTLLTNRSPMDLFTEDGSSPRWSAIPSPLLPVLFRATRHSPGDRFEDAAAMALALKRSGEVLETGLLAVPDAGENIPFATHPSWLSVLSPVTKGSSVLAPTTVEASSEATADFNDSLSGSRGWVGLGIGARGGVVAIGGAVALKPTGEPLPIDAPPELAEIATATPPAESPVATVMSPSDVELVELVEPVEPVEPAPEPAAVVAASPPKPLPPEFSPTPAANNRSKVAPQDSGPPPYPLSAQSAAPGGQWFLNVNAVDQRLRIVVDGNTVRGTVDAQSGQGRSRVAVRGTWRPAARTLQLVETGPEAGSQPARYSLRLDGALGRVVDGDLTHGRGGLSLVSGYRQPVSEW